MRHCPRCGLRTSVLEYLGVLFLLCVVGLAILTATGLESDTPAAPYTRAP